MKERVKLILQKGKILNEKELEIAGQLRIRRFRNNASWGKLMPYHYLREQ